jgi:glycosyltransferase involved in cell wall biosynthesis
MQQPTVNPGSQEPTDLQALALSGLDSAFQLDLTYVENCRLDSLWWGHIPFGQWLLTILQPHIVVEVSDKPSVSYDTFCRTAGRRQLNTVCYLVGARDDARSISHIGEARDELAMAVHKQGKNSPSDFNDGTIDLLHFADISENQEFGELFEAWKPKLSDRAVVMLHHINSKASNLAAKAWARISDQYSSFEFLHSDGLGVVAIGTNIDPAVSFLCHAPDVHIGRLRARFAVLGSWWERAAQELPTAEAHALERQTSAARAEQLSQMASAWEHQWRESDRARAQIASRLRVARHDLHHVQIENEALTGSFNALRAERDDAFRERDVILSSRAWLVASALIRVAGRFPKISRLAWRVARLSWWVVTFKLIRRLRERRRIRATLALQAISAQQAAPVQSASPVQPMAAAPVANFESSGPLMIEAEFTALARAAYVTFIQGQERLKFIVQETPDISVIIVARGPDYGLLECLRALRFHNTASIEVIIIDMGCRQTAELLSRMDNVSIISKPESVSLVETCNQAIEQSRGGMIALLDNCAEITADGLTVAQNAFKKHPMVGAITGRVLRRTKQVWEAGGIIWSNGLLTGYGRGFGGDQGEVMFRREVDYSGDTILFLPKSIFGRLGHFDRSYDTLPYAYADYAIRLRSAGYATFYEPRLTATIPLLDHEAALPEASRSDCEVFVHRHGEILSLVHSPAFSGNLLCAREHNASPKKRLLMVDNEVPYRALGSGYPRANELLWAASDLGWSVTLFPLRRSDFDWETVQHEFPEGLEIIKRHGADELRKLLEERNGYYQTILVSRPDNMETFHDAVRDAPRLLLGTRLVYDAEAVFSKREIVRAALEGTPFSPEEADALLNTEASIANGVDAITCVTAAEADFFRFRQPKPVYIISHSVNLRPQTPEFMGREGFLFVGRLLEPTAPNWIGLKWFIDACWPSIRRAIPDATLTVIGHLHPDHDELARPGVKLLGPIKDLGPHYDKARIFVAPIRFAAGVPLKIVESAAAGLPVAGTGLMAEQLLWRPGFEIIADDDPEVLAEDCIEIYLDADKWSAMRTSAFLQVEEAYSPKAFRRALESALSDLPNDDSLVGRLDVTHFQVPPGNALSV